MLHKLDSPLPFIHQLLWLSVKSLFPRLRPRSLDTWQMGSLFVGYRFTDYFRSAWQQHLFAVAHYTRAPVHCTSSSRSSCPLSVITSEPGFLEKSAKCESPSFLWFCFSTIKSQPNSPNHLICNFRFYQQP